jgi:DNA-binding NarL/FixJ family response regulator
MTAAESERPLRVLVADDHPRTRDDIRRALERAGDEVRGEALNAAEAVRAALACYPDICLLDLNMPG